jgi:(1->4)-alpha-D-glucan 1-alpha-D-glucosylmutase
LRPDPDNAFLADLQAMTTTVAWFGAFNSMALALLKFSCPGVPDLYQGMETMQLTLVDPDNRTPVDHDGLRDLLATLSVQDPAQAPALLERPADGRAKLWITWRMLALRQQHAQLLRDGDYTALPTDGAAAQHLIAFTRRLDSAMLVVLVPRLLARLTHVQQVLPVGSAHWSDTSVGLDLPDGTVLTDVLTGHTVEVHHGRIAVALAFHAFPMAAYVTAP